MKSALACLLVLALAVDADAQCMAPFARFAAGTGPLPANPTIYLFVPRHYEVSKLEANVPVTIDQVDANEELAVFRVRIQATSGTVNLRMGDFAAGSFTIGAVPANTARVTGVRHKQSQWSCSYTNQIILDVEGTAIAYRFDWKTGDQPLVVSAGLPVVGQISCLGHNSDPDRLGELRAFDLVALYADGSEQIIGSSQLKLFDEIRFEKTVIDPVRLPMELLANKPVPEPVDDDPCGTCGTCMRSSYLATATDEESADGSSLALFGALAGLGVLLLATRRA